VSSSVDETVKAEAPEPPPEQPKGDATSEPSPAEPEQAAAPDPEPEPEPAPDEPEQAAASAEPEPDAPTSEQDPPDAKGAPAEEDESSSDEESVAPPAEAARANKKPAKPKQDEPFVEDGRADKALDFVVDVLTKMGMDCTVDLMENDPTDPPSDIRIEVTGADAHRLIGRKGQTLAAMQFLTNRVVNRPSKPRRHILIDSDGYRAQREKALSSMAQRLAKQAVDEGEIIIFDPMSAQDRRIVHLSLAKFVGVVTKSEGKGASRRVQIIPVRD